MVMSPLALAQKTRSAIARVRRARRSTFKKRCKLGLLEKAAPIEQKLKVSLTL
jgi:hypothetical protein